MDFRWKIAWRWIISITVSAVLFVCFGLIVNAVSQDASSQLFNFVAGFGWLTVCLLLYLIFSIRDLQKELREKKDEEKEQTQESKQTESDPPSE